MLIVTNQNLYSVIDKLAQEKDLGLDTETTGLLWHDRLFSLQITSIWESYYFNFKEYEGLPCDHVLDRTKTFELLQKKVFSKPSVTWFIQNAKFDMLMLHHEGCELFGTVHCTKTGERLVRNNHFGKGAYSLEQMAKRRGHEKDMSVDKYITKHKLYTDIKVDGKVKAFRRKHFDRVPFEMITRYGCQDSHLHYLIGMEQRTAIKGMVLDHRATQRVYENELKLTKVCLEMEKKGILSDRDYIKRALENELSQMDACKANFLTLTGKPYKDSNKLFAEVFTAHKLSYPTTDKGNPSFAADVLEDIDNPIADAIKSIRRHEKYAGTYYANFLYLADEQGVIRASIDPAGTETGRFSYREPNLQNVPKEDDGEYNYYVRKSFVPREGNCFVSIDYAQIEYRVMADYAGEFALIKRINAGEDVHDVTADLLGISRKEAKTANFAILYGTGAAKLAKMLGVSEREAKELKAMYFGRLPKVSQFLEDVALSAKNRGFITNWFGRRCYLYHRDYAYKMPNHLVQGSCGDLMKRAMVRIWEDLSQIALVNVHDELLFELPKDLFSEIPRIQKIMNSSYEPKNGIKIDTSVSHSWVSWGFCDMKEGMS